MTLVMAIDKKVQRIWNKKLKLKKIQLYVKTYKFKQNWKCVKKNFKLQFVEAALWCQKIEQLFSSQKKIFDINLRCTVAPN